jgi:hypothetical protein
VSVLQRPSSEEFVDALSAQCDRDVLPTKLRPVKIEDEKENDFEIFEDKFDIYVLLLALGRYLCW